MRVQVVDPAAFTPPYDHALCAALGRAGADVELLTSRFLYGSVPREPGYRVVEGFYRHASRPGAVSRVGQLQKAVEHIPDMLRHRRRARAFDVVHYQWLPVPHLDSRLMTSRHPRLFTAHNPIEENRHRDLALHRRLAHAVDATVVHSFAGRDRLRAQIGDPSPRIEVIAHGALDYFTRLAEEAPLPSALDRVAKPVILFFGLLRPYKGLETLVRAFAGVEDAELWIVGAPRMPMAPLHELARRSAGNIRFVSRFVADAEVPAYFRRADIVVLPYTEADQSGVLFMALAFAKPIVASRVGGFGEMADLHGALHPVPPGDEGALREALQALVGDASKRERLAEAAARAAADPYSWDTVAGQTLSLYSELLERAG